MRALPGLCESDTVNHWPSRRSTTPVSTPSEEEHVLSLQPDVSVAIATYNRLSLLEELLERFDQQTLPASQFEVIVVDDGSSKPVRETLERKSHPFSLRVIEQYNAGAAAARRAAITCRDGSYRGHGRRRHASWTPRSWPSTSARTTPVRRWCSGEDRRR